MRLLITRDMMKEWRKTHRFSHYNYLIANGAPLKVNEVYFPAEDKVGANLLLSFDVKKGYRMTRSQHKDGVMYEWAKL